MSSEEEEASAGVDGQSRSLRVIALYYLLLIALGAVLAIQFPRFHELITQTGDELGIGREIVETFGGDRELAQGDSLGGVTGMIVGAVSMIGAVVLMVPVVWSYIVIKRRAGYHESVVHTLVILPVAVTGIVLIVQDSLALAFSLAGIVAAVRFRTTLKDIKDAVYVFLAIGVGLACGVQALEIALVLSLVFNAVNLLLWYTGFGNIYADQFDRTGALGLGDVLAGPSSGPAALSIGDKSLLSALTPQELGEATVRVARMERHLEAEADRHKERKKYAVLLVYSDRVGEAQQAVEPELEERSIRWRLVEILPHKGDVSIVEYLVRLRDGVSEGSLLDAIRRSGGDAVKAGEFRSLEGLKKK